MKFNSGSGDFEMPAPGTYAAVCYKVIDLGTQEQDFKGKITHARKLMLFWELNAQMSTGQRFSMFKEYTASLNEKANLRKDLESLTGIAFTDGMIKSFNPQKLIGAAGLVNVGPNSNDRIVIKGLAKLVAGMEKMKPENPTVYFDLDMFSEEAFNSLPDWLKNKIIQSPEYLALGPVAGVDAAKAGDDSDISF